MNKKSNMLHGLLQLVEASDGEVDSRIRMQKEAFLLAVKGFADFPKSSFSYHHYGPYSRELSDYLQFSVASDLLNEKSELGANDGKKYSYSLGSKGRKYLDDAGHMSGQFSQLIQACKREHSRTLELAATCLFLEISTSLGRDDAFSKSVKLKPDTSSYRDLAKNFLAQHFAQV